MLKLATRSLFIFSAAIFSVLTIAEAQTLYSRGNNNWNTLTNWSTTSGGGSCGCYPGDATHTGWSAVVRSGHTVTLTSTAYTLNSISSLSVDGVLNFGTNGGTAKTLTVSSNVDINAGATLQSGNTGATAHNLQIGGDLTNNGTFNLTVNNPTNQNVTFTGAGTISGSGATFTFYRLTMNTGGSNVNVNSSIRINGAANALTFSSNGILVVNSSSNITLGATATISGANASRYIQLDGATGSNSQLIKTNANTTASWQMNYPIGTSSGGYAPLNLPTVGGIAPTAGATLSVKAVYNASIQGQLRRTFRMVISGNATATTFTGPQFSYNNTTDVSGGDAIGNYNTIWHLSTGSGSWATLAGTAPGAGAFTVTAPSHQLVTGTYYYTIGSSTAYPNTWYSYQSGAWSNWENWTLDPSGTTLVNGLQLPPQPGDAIVILNGAIITNDVNGQVVSSTTINSGGTLDMAATTGNTLGTVSGAGLLRVNGVALPIGTYTSFVARTGGTVEYYNTGGALPAAQTTYNKLILSNNTGSAITFNTANNLTLNGDFNITQTGGAGTVTWMINNGTANRRTIVLNENLIISANGRIRASSSGATGPHLLTIYGNLTNNGSIKFFDDTDADLNADTDYTGGSVYTRATKVNAVNVTFSGADDQTVTCNNTTDFYRFIVDKGTGQQAKLTLNASDADYFRLWGPANLYSNTATGVSNCALSIVNGTLELIGTINIPVLIVNGAAGAPTDVFAIPQSGALWLNSPNVVVTLTNNDAGNDDQRLTVDGLFRVSNGSTFNSGFSRGIGSTNGGTIFIEGDSPLTKVNIWQYRPVFGGSGIFSYIQTGGEVNVGTTGYNGTPALLGVVDGITAQYARFSLDEPTSSFTMSGGTLNIGTPSQNTTTTGAAGIDIQCAAGNFNVTGGTINAYIPTGAASYDFGINTTAPLYNLRIWKEGATARRVTIRQDIVILKDLIFDVTNAPALYCNNNDLTVGGDIIIPAGASLNIGTTGTPIGTNIITLNGSTDQAWTHSGAISNLSTVVLNKTASVLTLGGSATFPNITNLTLTSGTLNDGGKVLTVLTTLNNSATHVSSIATGVIVANGPTAIGGSNGVFGNLTISTNGTVTTSGDQTVTNNLRLAAANSTLNIQSNSLTVLGNIYDAAAGTTTVFTTTKRIQTLGLRNDGGLTRQGTAGNLLFPVGITGTTAYTPATINAAATTQGRITVRPVTGAHPNLPAVSVGQSLTYYWRVTTTGFSGVSSVTHGPYNYGNAALIQGVPASYRVARYDGATFMWTGVSPHTASGTIINPPGFTFSFGLNIDGDYTSGNITTGSVAVFYSRQNGNWNVNTTWSSSPCGGAGTCGSPLPAGGVAGVNFPGPNNPVVIGNVLNNHTVTVDSDGRSCGSLLIETGSTLDCNTRINLNFGPNTTEGVSGKGTLKISAATAGIGVFPAGDFTNFIGPNGGTVEWYGNTKTLPSTGPGPNNLVLDNFYNLKINPAAGQTITLAPSNLTVYSTFTINDDSDGGTVQTDNTASRTITLNGNFNIANGVFNIRTNGGNTVLSNFNLTSSTGNLTVASGATFSVVAGGTATHSLTTYGDIVNNGTLNFRNGSSVNLLFVGSTNNMLTGTNGAASTTLSFVTLNKGTDQTYSITMDIAGAMPAPPNDWLILQNGTMIFANSLTFTLDNTATIYSIPSTAKLKVQSGTVNILSNASNNADLLLSGGLEVSGTGTVAIGSAGGDFNNDIEYAASGSPSITVSGGTLTVNGAIRRSTSTLSGALVYNQSGGTVTVAGRNCDANVERGVFEIESNEGSSFTMTGGILNVQRSTGPTAPFADLYINPESSTVTAGTIQIGMSTNTSVTSPLTVNIVPSIYNFTVLGTTTAQVVDMRSSELSTSGTLTINTNSTLETNALDVNIGGDLNITGVYNGTVLGGNTTTFNGSGPQTGSLTAGSTFQNITINKSAGTATLNGNSSINNLNILSGTLSVTNTLDISGDIINNSVQSGAGTLNIAGAAATHSITSSNGTFGNLSLGGTAVTKTVNVSGNTTITGTLNFTTSGTSRYLNIGSNRLAFSQSASNVSNAGTNRFIKTNGVASDLGVVKDWTAGLSTFVYAVGTRTNYTPASFTLTVTSQGTFTVIPVDDQHPTADAVGEQILNYYWIVTRGAGLAYNATGSHSYQFPTGFIGGSGGTLIAAHLDAIKLVGWTPSPGNGGSFTTAPPNTTMTFTNSLNTNLPGTGGVNPEVQFHYTAGTNATLPSPVTPVYSRLELAATVGNSSTGGDWNLASNWTTSPTGFGGTVQTNVPTGRPVVILSGGRINMNIAGLSAFSTRIDGLLVMVNATGHNLGSISGTGTLRAITSTLPAGNYTSFVSSAGGTIEYSPTTDINMNNRSDYNNVSIVGSNIVTMTNVDLNLNGNLTIASGATLNNTTNNRDVSITGNISNAGIFSPGSGTVNIGGNWSNTGTYNQATSTVNFTGSGAQGISGSNAFYNLGVAKSGNAVTLNASTTVTNALTLTTGNIITTTTNPLILTNTATSTTGNANSFVSGPMIKTFNGSFTFPAGSSTVNRYRPATISATSASDTWTVEYVGNNPTNQGYSNTSFNSAAPANLRKVSEFEYWNVSRLGATTAALELTYNVGSYLVNPSHIGNVANLKIVRWTGAPNNQWDLPPGGGTFTQTGTNITGTVKVSLVTDFSPFTFGSLDPNSPLPITLMAFNAKLNNDHVDLTWRTAQEINNNFFVVEKTADLESFSEVGIVEGHGDSKESHSYFLMDPNPSYGRSYYRLKQVDFDGKFSYSDLRTIDYEGPQFATLRAYPSLLKDDNLTVDVIGLKDSKMVAIKIYNLHGQVVFDKIYEVKTQGRLIENLAIGNLMAPGLYIIKAGSTLHLTQKIVVE